MARHPYPFERRKPMANLVALFKPDPSAFKVKGLLYSGLHSSDQIE